ncbi:MAG: outer membrane protein assembly factor BamD, partial [Acidobacteriota bacterium]|nr:outer membrane protein assembly factor BamD [Acidobacteriota bacterium]
EAIADLRDVMRRYPTSPYADAALDMIARAETTLASHDYAVGRFYFKKKAWDAASQRFKRILDRYPRYRNREELYYYLGRALFRAENELEGRIYLERVIQDYPDGKLAKESQKFLDKAAATAAADGDAASGEEPTAGATDTAEGPRQ